MAEGALGWVGGGQDAVVISASTYGGLCELGHERQQSILTVLTVKQRITNPLTGVVNKK